MMRVLALDYGLKRIGVALSDERAIVAQPYGFLLNDRDKKWLDQIVRWVKELGIRRIVIGLPLNMNGTDSEMSQVIRQIAEEVRHLTQVEVILWDERLTSRMAENVLIMSNMRRKKRKLHIDSLSAVILLQNYLDRIGFSISSWDEQND